MSSYNDCIEQEQISQSPYSPGLIADDELVARVLLTPKHVKNGQVLPVAFEQVLQSQGFSILRHGKYFNKSLVNTIKLLETVDNKYTGYVTANVKEIRNIFIQNTTFRLFIVTDTATKDRKAHADIFTTRNTIEVSKLGIKKSLIKYIRFQITKLFNQTNLKNHKKDSQ